MYRLTDKHLKDSSRPAPFGSDKKYGTPRNSTQPSKTHYSAVVSGAVKWNQVLGCDHCEYIAHLFN